MKIPNTRKAIGQLIRNLTLTDIPDFWRGLAMIRIPGINPKQVECHPADLSRVQKYLPYAVGDMATEWQPPSSEPKPAKLDEKRRATPLSSVFHGPVELLAARGRALFLAWQHGLDPAFAVSPHAAKALPKSVRIAALNVAGSLRRFLLLMRAVGLPRYSTPVDHGWPTFPKEKRWEFGGTLWRVIVRSHVVEQGVLDPNLATKETVGRALTRLIERATHQRSGVRYNSYLAALRNAIQEGALPGITESLLDGFEPLRFGKAAPPLTLSERELLRRWPDVFVADPNIPEAADRFAGLPGFFNRAVRAWDRPQNANGNTCPLKNRLSDSTMEVRLQSLRRYLAFWLEKDPGATCPEIPSLFTPDKIKTWVRERVETVGATVYVSGEYWHVLMTSVLYFGHTCTETHDWVQDHIGFPESSTFSRGPSILATAGPDDLLKLIFAMGWYAEQVPHLVGEGSEGVGFYLSRKSVQIGYSLMTLTGLRPGNVGNVEFLETRNDQWSVSTLWPEPGGFGFFCPLKTMKDRKRHGTTTHAGPSPETDKKPPGYYFPIRWPAAVQSIQEYLDYGWRFANCVAEGRTRKLMIRKDGQPYGLRGFNEACRRLNREVARAWRNHAGEELVPLIPYAARHIIGEYLHRHDPTGRMKSWFLTHAAGKGADQLYGNGDATPLCRMVEDILSGNPPIREQQEADRQEIARKMGEQNELLRKLTADRAADRAEIIELRRQLDAERSASHDRRKPRNGMP